MNKLVHTLYAVLALAAAMAGIATITWGNVIAAGGLDTNKARILIASACMLVVLSLIVAHCWGHRRRGLAMLMGLALAGMEAHNVWTLIEHNMTARETVRRTGEAILATREAAQRRLDEAERALFAIGSSSPRLQLALTAKAEADQAAVDKSAQRGCASNCRQLLQQQVDSAQAEVIAARAEISERRRRVEDEVAAARAAIAALPAPATSGMAVASTFGYSGASVDIASSLLFALPINVGSIALLMFVGHGRGHVPIAPEQRATRQAIRPEDHGRAFFESAMTMRPRARTALDAVESSYRQWCVEMGVEPLSSDEIGRQLAAEFVVHGIRGRVDNGTPKLIGVALV